MTNAADKPERQPEGSLLTVADVAQRLTISSSLVYQLVESAKLPHHRIGNGRGTIRVSENDLESYLANCHQDSLSHEPASRPRKAKLKHIQI